MTVSTRANWKDQVQADTSQRDFSSTNGPGSPGSPLSELSDENGSSPNTPSPSPSKTTRSHSQKDISPPRAELTANEDETENHPADDSSQPLADNTSAVSITSRDLTLTQSSYTHFLGEFSLSPTSSLSQSSASTNDDQIFIAASLLTPIGSRLTYYSNPLNWSLFRPESEKPSQILTENDIVQSLYLNASYANKRSILLLEDSRYIQNQVKKMFAIKPDSKMADYAHVLLQVAVLDRFVWSSLPLQTTDILRHASNSHSCDLPDHALSLIGHCKNWQKTLATAAANFLVHENPEKEPATLQTSNSQQCDAAVASLGMRLAVSKNDTLVNHVEQNFISAAIALRSLAEVNYNFLLFVNVLIIDNRSLLSVFSLSKTTWTRNESVLLVIATSAPGRLSQN